jgi:O-antigen/teichoic acid export membrane protein
MWPMLVLAPIASVLWLVAPLLKIVVGDEFGGSVTMTRWLVFWLPCRVMSLPPRLGLLGLGRMGIRLVVLIVSATISMVLYLILIPKLGSEGAVIGTVVSEICLAVFGWSALLWAQRERDGELDENRGAHAMDGPSKWVSARRRHS